MTTAAPLPAEPADTARTWRWTLARANEDETHRSVLAAGGVPATPPTGPPAYRLAGCRVRFFDGDPSELRVDGPSEDAVRNAARRMLYPDTEGTVTLVSPKSGAHGSGRA